MSPRHLDDDPPDDEDELAPPGRRPSGPLDALYVWGPRLLLLAGAVVLVVALVLMVTEDDDDGGGGGGGEDPPANTFGPAEPAPGSEPEGSGTSPSTEEGAAGSLPEVDGPFAAGRTPLAGFGEIEVRVVGGPDGDPIVLCVLVAETPEQRARGLMQVSDPSLGGYDGMLFRFDEDVDGGFYMKDTLLPLSIAYLDDEGATVDTEDMEPCPPSVSDCPSYPPSEEYRSALEVPQGDLDELGLAPGSAARLEVGDACPAVPAPA